MSLVIAFNLIHIFLYFTAPSFSEIYTLSLHDALPIFWFFSASPAAIARTIASLSTALLAGFDWRFQRCKAAWHAACCSACERSEEHTSELQSRGHLVCRLLLEKNKLYSSN